MPLFAVGEQVKFTICKKGELLAKGINIPFISGSPTANVYTGKPSRKAPNPPLGTVYKTSEGEPKGLALQFFQVKLSHRIPTVYVVWYILGDTN